MRRARRLVAATVLVLASALAPAARAEAPETALRPPARSLAEAGAGEVAPIRPPARPVADAATAAALPPRAGGAPLALEVRPDGQPEALLGVAEPAAPGTGEGAGPPRRDHLPFVPRRPPLLLPDAALAPPALVGPRQVVRAEAMMAPLPPIPVVVGGWAGAGPLGRPAASAEPSAPPVDAPGRPRARPGAGAPPDPGLPAEPDPPEAYAPDGRPTFVPGPDVTDLAVAEAALPLPRPQGIVERAEQARAEAAREAERAGVEAARGQVCGNPLIQGTAEASFSSGGCGIDDPVRVRSVDGVRLSEPALMDCATAGALLDWVREGARPALAGRGGGLARIDVMGHYACRPRNNQAGQRLSEHGLGHAIDVGGLTLADGSSLTVLGDWPGDGLREMHRAACGPFSTVLGPEANSFHRNHFHFDTARGRGPYCR